MSTALTISTSPTSLIEENQWKPAPLVRYYAQPIALINSCVSDLCHSDYFSDYFKCDYTLTSDPNSDDFIRLTEAKTYNAWLEARNHISPAAYRISCQKIWKNITHLESAEPEKELLQFLFKKAMHYASTADRIQLGLDSQNPWRRFADNGLRSLEACFRLDSWYRVNPHKLPPPHEIMSWTDVCGSLIYMAFFTVEISCKILWTMKVLEASALVSSYVFTAVASSAPIALANVCWFVSGAAIVFFGTRALVNNWWIPDLAKKLYNESRVIRDLTNQVEQIAQRCKIRVNGEQFEFQQALWLERMSIAGHPNLA